MCLRISSSNLRSYPTKISLLEMQQKNNNNLLYTIPRLWQKPLRSSRLQIHWVQKRQKEKQNSSQRVFNRLLLFRLPTKNEKSKIRKRRRRSMHRWHCYTHRDNCRRNIFNNCYRKRQKNPGIKQRKRKLIGDISQHLIICLINFWVHISQDVLII